MRQQPPKTINVGRRTSGGIFGGLLGNPVVESEVSDQYRRYIRKLLRQRLDIVDYLKIKMALGFKLFCPGCGVDAPKCHARIIEQELANESTDH